MDKWLAEIQEEIKIESLPEAYRVLAEVIGIENTLKIARHVGGLVYYFPKIDRLLQEIRDDMIRREFNGSNHKPLALKYGLTERWVRDIVQRRTADYDQTSLFEVK